jgi:hypothetical protein
MIGKSQVTAKREHEQLDLFGQSPVMLPEPPTPLT